jgi:hypothetical protein
VFTEDNEADEEDREKKRIFTGEKETERDYDYDYDRR